ncbi:MAG: hypothetical protein K9W43_11045 [Candidatus Thorarchaeota archaeon]|nr:hypothetical protein [Candidatus Thorarchaeota archaeon]
MHEEQFTKISGTTYHWYNIFGVSGSTVREMIHEFTGGEQHKKYILTRCCGKVRAGTALGQECLGADCGTGSGGDCGEGLCFCLLLSMLMMVVVTIVWVAVMVVFSFVTVGGFVKRRYRTAIFLEKKSHTFLAKISLAVAQLGGVLDYPIGVPDYDHWVSRTVRLFKYLKYIRQLSLFLGTVWGFNEVYFKLKNIFDPTFHYNLWPFRFAMVIIFIPLIFSSPILEIKIREAIDIGEGLIHDVIAMHPEYTPSSMVSISHSYRSYSMSDESDSYDVDKEWDLSN